MTLRGATKPNWSRPPAANGPERNSPGWVMTVFSAFLFTPFWCPRTPHLTPAATSPCPSLSSPLPPPFSQTWVALSSRVIHTNPNVRTMQNLCVRSSWQQMLQTYQAGRTRGNYMFRWHTVPQPGGGACLTEKGASQCTKSVDWIGATAVFREKVVLERQLAYFVFIYSFHYFNSRLKSNTMTLDKGIRPPGQQYSNFYFTLPYSKWTVTCQMEFFLNPLGLFCMYIWKTAGRKHLERRGLFKKIERWLDKVFVYYI